MISTNSFFIFSYPLGLLLFVVGMCFGSFLNVVIYRLPIILLKKNNIDIEVTIEARDLLRLDNLSLISPRSFCPTCLTTLRWFENIPIISYFFLNGRCDSCTTPIRLRYPLIELLTGLLTVLLGFHFGITLKFFGSCIFVYILISLCFIDLDNLLLPDLLTIPLIWIGLFVNSFDVFVNLIDAVYGAIFGYLILWFVFWIFKLFTGKNGFGYGDFKLLSALGAWLGWVNLPMIILISSLLGSVVGLALLTSKKITKDTLIPFGPYLIIATLFVMFVPRINIFI